MKLLYWSNSDGSGSKKAQKTHLVPKNMVRILKSNVQYHKVFSKIFLQFFFIPIRKNAWISIFFTKFSGNIEIFSASPRILSILPSNLVKKILIQAFFLIGNKKKLQENFFEHLVIMEITIMMQILRSETIFKNVNDK